MKTPSEERIEIIQRWTAIVERAESRSDPILRLALKKLSSAFTASFATYNSIRAVFKEVEQLLTEDEEVSNVNLPTKS